MKNSMTTLLCTGILTLIFVSHANSQVTFQLIENTTGPGFWSYAYGVSADGTTVFGDESGYGLGWIWTEAEGFRLIDGHRPSGSTGDGKMLAGNTSPGQGVELNYPGRWTESTGWVGLGQLPGAQSCDMSYGSAYDISRDGSIVVGLGWANVCDGVPFRWSEGLGMHQAPMEDPIQHYAARINTVSGDGRTLGGWEASDFGLWRPVIWRPDATQLFPAPDPDDTPGEVMDINFDGSIVVGFANISDTGNKPFRWTEEMGFEILPVPSGTTGLALSVSDDGRVMAGRYGPMQACIWLDGVPYNLRQYLINNGVTGLENTNIWNAFGVSADGTVITGTCYPDITSDLIPTAFRVTMPKLPSCPADLTGDSQVNIDDIFAVLGLWGECPDPCPPYCPGDLSEDCTVNIDDIFAILGLWGPCEPLGACCSYEGTICQDLTRIECNITGGTWNPDVVCAIYTCPGAPLAACCLEDLACVMLDERDCPWAGGTWYAREDCATFTCPASPAGACCLWPTDECAMLSEFGCESVDGIFYGEGVECSTVTCPLPVQGDVIEDPYIITSLPYVDANDTTGFTHDYDESCDGPGSPIISPDVVYAYTPTADETVTFSMCDGTSSTFQARLYIYEDTEGNLFACSEDGDCPYWPYSPLLDAITLSAGHTYYIIVDGDRHNEEEPYTLNVSLTAGGACCMYPLTTCVDATSLYECEQLGGIWQGEYTECATASCPTPPVGDRVEDPIVINSLPYTDYREFPETGPWGVPGVLGDWYEDGIENGGNTYWSHNLDVIYTYTPSVDMQVNIMTCNQVNPDPSTMLFVFDGMPVFGNSSSETFGNYIAFGDLDSCSPGAQSVAIWNLSLTAGHTYYIVVDSDCYKGTTCGSGEYQLDIEVVGAR